MNRNILIVIGLACALVAAVVIAVISLSRSPNIKRHEISPQIQIRNLSMALDSYQMENGAYPTTEQGLKALLEKPTIPPIPKDWTGPYLKKEIIDPWGNPYQYRCPSQHNRPDFDLWSFGPDGKDGTGDEIIVIRNK
ncbi:MAG: type II secretion system major pseudopilin GspG [Planctomycetes bacterium]|nr:type II secretion system major pseudopilin GspG [Planctomycetota bacterium]